MRVSQEESPSFMAGRMSIEAYFNLQSAPMRHATPSRALHHLLDESLRYPPEYGDHLSSHLPMALAALDGLGADEARLRAFFAFYVRRFTEPLRAAPSLRSGFAAALARDGRDTVLREALPRLMTGVGAAAFHGVIRTAHAVESRHEGELAAALAYWAARWSRLPPSAVVKPDIDGVADWLDAVDRRLLQADPDWPTTASTARLISDRMLQAAHTTAYRETVGRLRIAGCDPGALLHELALSAAVRYAATRHFTVLHMATGARAVRVLAPWLPPGGDVLVPLFQAVAAASLASDTASAVLGTPTVRTDLGWPQVCALARASDNDHVIKLVHAMAAQQALAQHPAWLQAAVAAVTDS
jgi:Questin oxidase-like